MYHNYQIAERGECKCKCHTGAQGCTCGIPKSIRNWFSPPKPPRKMRKVNLESRVQPFTKQRKRISVIAVTKEHGFHAIPYLHKEKV